MDIKTEQGRSRKLTVTRFRVLNFRNIDDSGWIELEQVTAFVGRNESGKTSLLKALHKFNPATDEPYVPLQEFPRDRYTAEFQDGGDWPVCRVEFELSADFHAELGELLDLAKVPKKAILTRHYDGSLKFDYAPAVSDDIVDPIELVEALKLFASDARRLSTTSDLSEEQMQALRAKMAKWADGLRELARTIQDLRSENGVNLLDKVRQESDEHAQPASADIVEVLQQAVNDLTDRAKTLPLRQRLREAIEAELPVFIYFENYGILDSAVYLPRFVEDLSTEPNKPRIRTINAMFKHVNLDAQEIKDLGWEDAEQSRDERGKVRDDVIGLDRERKELRSVKLNSASIDISKRFSRWYGQRRHKIRYQADGGNFRIWVSDDRRPDVDIQLESRSKGFQWFFSFYLGKRPVMG